MSVLHVLIATLLSLSAAVPALAAPTAPAPEGEPITVLLLGTHHLHNPGGDVVNLDTDDVLAPARQRELEALGEALLEFRPNKVAVEARVSNADLVWPHPLDPGELATDRNEITQIAQRVAMKAGLERMYAVDVEGAFDLAPLQAITREPGAGHLRDAMAHVTELGEAMADACPPCRFPPTWPGSTVTP